MKNILENGRFAIISSKHDVNAYIYDKLLDKTVIEICTGNKSGNDLIAKAALLGIGFDADLMRLVDRKFNGDD